MIHENYRKKGYLISKKILKKDDILSMRNDLDLEFANEESNAKLLHDFKNEKLIKKIISLYKHDILKNIKNELIKISDSNLTLLPHFIIQKNYHVDLRQFHGWHRDCAGELIYDYCKNIHYSKNYFFSKVGFYLQENTEYGGSIDVIKTSHKHFSKFKTFFRKIKIIPFKIITLVHKHFRNFYNIIPESFFMFLLNAKRLYPEPGSAVIFDYRLLHRGSPISKKRLKEINFKKGQYQAVTSKDQTKYSIYCHLGTRDAVDSYFFDRLKRSDNFSKNELKTWIDQIDFISKYDNELSKEMSKLFSPIMEKYQKVQ